MDDAQLRNFITMRLERSTVVGIMANELCALIEDKPTSISPDHYFHAVATSLLEILRRQLLAHCKPGVINQQPDDETVDYNRILQGLLIGLERDLLESNLHMIRALGGAIAERDTGTNEHNYRVTIYAVRLAETMLRPPETVRSLIKGAFIHDIGKIGIPDAILTKSTGLTKKEREIMNSHVLRGAHIVGPATWLKDAIDVVRYHHEHYDGNGYLAGLVGDEIPLTARIFAVGDVFDALTSKRPYKVPYAFAEALGVISEQSGKHFDPSIVRAFVDIAEDVYLEVNQADCDQKETTIRRFMRDYFGFDSTRSPLPSPCE